MRGVFVKVRFGTNRTFFVLSIPSSNPDPARVFVDDSALIAVHDKGMIKGNS